MIKLAFFDFSKTIAKGSGISAVPAFMHKETEFDKYFEDFTSNRLKHKDFIELTIKLWEGFKEEDLPKIYPQIELRPNVSDVLKQLKNMEIKLALITYMPQKLAELYRNLSFDFIYGTECEIKDGIFTGKVLKMNTNKGIIAKKILDELGFKPNDCIAVGDSKADVEMFEAVGRDNSFTIDANEEIKKYAKHHIKDFIEIVTILKK
jgi:phosphoserine phosphatase